ncbi:MAG: nucleotidyl transferase AbiEii/AbiGii toxin family protein [Proteobacteria bacterium]|nr:nucleotidyl transferase AbiEii/AbiGii toxin family protein [Pseudomonadota bacterium]
MTNTSLKLQNSIDPKTLSLFKNVDKIANNLYIPYVVVGATARDLILHHVYDARIVRATTDVDFGIQVSDWSIFEKLKIELLNNGFQETNTDQRFKSPESTMIDIVPFGKIEDNNSNIKWPQNREIEMNVLGFKEVYEHAIQVIIQDDPLMKIPVVSPQGIVLLKIIAWSDRDISLRKKDALDLVYIFENYEHVSNIRNRIYEEIDMENYDWEILLASAHLLGLDSATIAKNKTKNKIMEILSDNLKLNTPSRLVEEMCNDIKKEYHEKIKLLQAFTNGFE